MLPRRRLLATLLLATLAGAGVWLVGKTTGCAVTPEGFRTAAPPAQPTDLLAGAWEGTWSSKSKPLHGRLSAIIEKTPAGDYRANFLSQNPLGSDDKSVCLFHISDRGPVWKFHGQEDLGLLKGGTYTYLGSVDGQKFLCTYDSVFDPGTFQMQRAPQN